MKESTAAVAGRSVQPRYSTLTRRQALRTVAVAGGRRHSQRSSPPVAVGVVRPPHRQRVAVRRRILLPRQPAQHRRPRVVRRLRPVRPPPPL